MNLPKKTLVLIDGHAHLFQAFHAITHLSDPKGRPVNAIYGVLNMLFKILEQFPCSHLSFIFDSPGPTFRHEMFPEYKANRGQMDDDLKEQIPRLHDVLKKMNFPVIAKQGFECDDIVGTLSTQAEKEGFHVIMISDDKDFGQLITENVVQYKNRKGVLLKSEDLHKEYGIWPNQVIDYLALVGDSSDNVPGIPGVGPKTAQTLLETYTTVENLYQHLDDLKGKRRENIENNRETFDLARELVTIRRDVPLDISLDDFVRQEWDSEQVSQLFKEFGFNRFLERFDLTKYSSKSSGENKRENEQKETISRNYETICDLESLKTLLTKLKKFTHLAVDTETTGLNPYEDELVGISFSWESGQGAYIALKHPEQETDALLKEYLTLESSHKILAPFLKRSDVTWIGHNLKFDAGFLHQANLPLGPKWEDTLLMSFVLNSANRRLKLDYLAWDLLNEKMIPIEELIGKGKKSRKMSEVPLDEIAPYAAEDADMTLRLFNHFQETVQTDDRQLEKYREQEIPLSQLLLTMERHGVRLDREILAEQSRQTKKELTNLEKKIFDSVGHTFNVGSPKQLGEVLFDELKLPVVKKTKTGYSTDSKVLAKLAPLHEVPGYVEEFRQLSKLKSTYMDALPELVDSQGILHTTFSQVAAITGRLSSNHPNLQNIPIRSPKGRAIRKAFCPKEHNLFLSVDYSQIELRLMAHYSEDPSLCQAFADGLDIHRFVAAKIHKIPQEDVTDDQRASAKAVNFGILFGQGAFGLSQQLGISQPEAKEFIEDYFQKFGNVQSFVEQTIETAKRNGYVETYGGHRRAINEFQSSNQIAQRQGERIAVNTLMQGSEADIIKTAMLRIEDWLNKNQRQTTMVLQIHDELVFDIRSEDVKELEEALDPLMTEGFDIKVPLEINTHSGTNWLEAK